MSKQSILERVRDSLHSNPLHVESSHYTNPLKSAENDKVQEYITLQRANKAIVIESSPTTLISDIHKALAEVETKKILYNPNIVNALDIQALREANAGASMVFIPYEKGIDESRDELFSIDTSIIHACCGVANLGIIGIASHKYAPRLSSLVTRTCIVLLKKADIVEDFYQGVCALKAQSENGALPTNMIFIAGPSRTADIELQTVFGVHGSLRTYVIVY
ncbi:lactate utilization protein C [uncultured Helicobacter sp.]|uniref:LutC/YkgG family protein n=1 Tax=uncultured Helicobacter sp. TaxID=175537 RepID=UPI0026EA4C78|nr:lactate utilization protein C [uncultured Helicobacter sp.]